MTQKSLWRGILVAVLSVVLIRPALADKPRLALHPHLLNSNSGGGFKKLGDEIVIGIVVVAVAVGVLVTVLIVHYKSKKRTAITGCVHSGANGMSVTDEKDKRDYALSGDTAGVKPGDRMTLEGKVKHTGKTLVFESQRIIRDFGACQPAP
jgi:hypothetical protein